LVGFLTGSSSSFSRGALPNILYEEPFSIKNKGAGAVLEPVELLTRSPPNYPLKQCRYIGSMSSFSFSFEGAKGNSHVELICECIDL
jgi:hypothetical protein